MSTLLTLTSAVSADPAAFVAAGSGTSTGIIDWLTTKLNELQALFRGVSIAGGMGFVIFQAISSRGALARIIIAGLAAGLFIWVVWNVTALKDRVDGEVNAVRAPYSQSEQVQTARVLAFSNPRTQTHLIGQAVAAASARTRAA